MEDMIEKWTEKARGLARKKCLLRADEYLSRVEAMRRYDEGEDE